jgi:hypothetical protein
MVAVTMPRPSQYCLESHYSQTQLTEESPKVLSQYCLESHYSQTSKNDKRIKQIPAITRGFLGIQSITRLVNFAKIVIYDHAFDVFIRCFLGKISHINQRKSAIS